MKIRIPPEKLRYSMELPQETKPSAPRTVNILLWGGPPQATQQDGFNIVHTVENLKEGEGHE